jgi:hypothetical protein
MIKDTATGNATELVHWHDSVDPSDMSFVHSKTTKVAVTLTTCPMDTQNTHPELLKKNNWIKSECVPFNRPTGAISMWTTS